MRKYITEGNGLALAIVLLSLALVLVTCSKYDNSDGFEECVALGGKYSKTDTGYACSFSK